MKMSMTVFCRECGENFRKFSIKSRETVCPDCRTSRGKNRYKIMGNKTLDAITTIENMDKKIADLTTSIDVLHSTIAVEVQHQISKGIEPIVHKIVEDSIKEKYGSMMDNIATAITKSRKIEARMQELEKLVKNYKTSHTKMKNKLKEFSRRLNT